MWHAPAHTHKHMCTFWVHMCGNACGGFARTRPCEYVATTGICSYAIQYITAIYNRILHLTLSMPSCYPVAWNLSIELRYATRDAFFKCNGCMAVSGVNETYVIRGINAFWTCWVLFRCWELTFSMWLIILIRGKMRLSDQVGAPLIVEFYTSKRTSIYWENLLVPFSIALFHP